MSRDRFNFLSYLMDDDEDDEEDDALLVMILASVPLEKKRASFHVRDRLEWDRHVAQLENEGPRAFLALYRMDHQSITKLCSLVDPFVSVDPVMSEVRTGKGRITTEIALHCLVRWLCCSCGWVASTNPDSNFSHGTIKACVQRAT
jgi:hypothetical protein